MKGQVFLNPPADFNSKVEVATCYIRHGDKLLFVQRRREKSQGGLWGIPGGKTDQGKSVESEMIREIWEETAIDLAGKPIEAFGSVYIRYPTIDYIYRMFGVLLEGKCPPIILNPEEHIDYAWLSLKEAMALPLILFEEACTFLVWHTSFFDGCEKPLLQEVPLLSCP